MILAKMNRTGLTEHVESKCFCWAGGDFCHSVFRFDLDKLRICQFKLEQKLTLSPIQRVCYRTATGASRCFLARSSLWHASLIWRRLMMFGKHLNHRAIFAVPNRYV